MWLPSLVKHRNRPPSVSTRKLDADISSLDKIAKTGGENPRDDTSMPG